jgi:hypothetical protein
MPTKRNTNLRAVNSSDIPVPPPAPKTITEAAASGSQRELLVSLRTRVAEAVQDPDCPPRDLAALSRRLQELSKEIAAIDLREAQEAGGHVEVGDGEFDAAAI